MASRVGRSFSSTGGSSHAEKIVRVQGALIVGITEKEHKHFVVYRGTDFRWVYVADPIRGNNRLLINDFARQWQKNLALAIAKPGAQVRTTSPLSLRGSDLFLGQTNDQLILMQPSRAQPLPARVQR